MLIKSSDSLCEAKISRFLFVFLKMNLEHTSRYASTRSSSEDYAKINKMQGAIGKKLIYTTAQPD